MWNLKEFSALRSDQHTAISLQFAAKRPKRGYPIGGIEYRKPAKFRMLDDGKERGIVNCIRETHGKDDVVKRAEMRRGGRGDATPISVDWHLIGVNAELFEHRSKKCGLVFAITVAMGKCFVGGVRLPSPDAEFDGDVANNFLHELGENPQFFEGGGKICGELRNLLFDRWRSRQAPLDKLILPTFHLRPVQRTMSGAAGGIRETNMIPASPFQGCIWSSGLISGICLRTHCHWLFPTDSVVTSG